MESAREAPRSTKEKIEKEKKKVHSHRCLRVYLGLRGLRVYLGLRV
jgi:hypothetical protein